MEENQKTEFRYTYSAREQAQIREIRSRYLPREESKLETLRRLDASPARRAAICALTLGILGTLVMGTGMSCCLVWAWFAPGIIIGLTGMALAAGAYPLYCRVLKKERERIAPQILRLTDELMK